MLDLSGSWTLADAARQFTAPITLPGDVHSALLAAGRTISARTTADHGFHHGQPVSLGFDISKASLFDQETEKRL